MDGGGVDIHKLIGKLPKPKGGFTLPGHKYTGPYNDLDSQLRYDPNTGEILQIFDQQAEKLMQSQCNMMWIIPFVEIIKNAKMQLTEKW